MIENVTFFQQAILQDMLIQTFVVRALLTPFAHPLFTLWTGLAIGLAVRNRKSTWTALWGLGVAIALHAAWNGSLTIGETDGGAVVILITLVLFVALFAAVAIGLQLLNKRDMERYRKLIPFLASRYNMSHEQVALLLDRKALSQARARTPNKADAQSLMMRASAMSRLAALFDHDDNPDASEEARLVAKLGG